MTARDEHGQPRIQGYRPLSNEQIEQMNRVKDVEVEVADVWHEIRQLPEADLYWTDQAKSLFEQGFMALNRSVARPANPFDTSV